MRINLADAASLTDIEGESFRLARAQLSLKTMASKTEDFYRDLLARVPAKH